MSKTKTTTPLHKTHYLSKKLRGEGSLSQPPWDKTRFTSRENENWHRLREDKDFIIKKGVVDNVNDYFHISDIFGRLGWNSILRLPRYFYLVIEFYANIEDKEKYTGSHIDTHVQGRRIQIL